MLLGKITRDIGNFVVTLSQASAALDISSDAFKWRSILFEAPISHDSLAFKAQNIARIFGGLQY